MSTLLPSEAVIRGNPTKAVVDVKRVRGADFSVANETERNSIDPDIRRAGMYVRLVSDDTTWRLDNDLSTWTEVTFGGGGGGSATYGGDLSGSDANQSVSKILGIISPNPSAVAVDKLFTVTSDSVFTGAYSIANVSGLLWVSAAGTNDEANGASAKILRVVNGQSNPPQLVETIDIGADYSFKALRQVRKSFDGNYVFVCLFSTYDVVGRVLVFDAFSYEIVGNAQTTLGPIGDDDYLAQGPIDCVDDGTHLWVINSNGQTANVVEKFVLATVLSNGTTPTSSSATISTPQHSECICFGAGYVWTNGGLSYSINRINPTTNVVDTYIDDTYHTQGCSFFFGSVWSGTSGPEVLRFDPAEWGTVDFRTAEIVTNLNSSKNAFASDGSFLWVGSSSYNPTSTLYARINPETNAVPGYHGHGDMNLGTSTNIKGMSGASGAAWDGARIWFTRRNQSPRSDIIGVDPNIMDYPDRAFAGPFRLAYLNPAIPPIPYVWEIHLSNGRQTVTTNDVETRIAERVINIDKFPALIGSLVRSFKVFVQGDLSTGVGTLGVKIYNVTSSEFLQLYGDIVFTDSVGSEQERTIYASQEVGSGYLISGNTYQVLVTMSGAGVAVGTISSVRIEISYS